MTDETKEPGMNERQYEDYLCILWMLAEEVAKAMDEYANDKGNDARGWYAMGLVHGLNAFQKQSYWSDLERSWGLRR